MTDNRRPGRRVKPYWFLFCIFMIGISLFFGGIESDRLSARLLGDWIEARWDGESLSWGVQRNSHHQVPEIEPRLERYLLGRGFWLGNRQQSRIYLTLNCGWENGLTPKILDILKQQQVQVTFFLTGGYIDKNEDLVKRMAEEGHQIGNHGNTHRSFPGLSSEEMSRELDALNEKVLSLTGSKPRYFRPPSGDFDQRTLRIAEEMGMKTVFWSIAYYDWDVNHQPSRQEAFRTVVDNVHNGAIIMLHNVSRSNLEALPDIINELKEQGYSFGHLDEITI